MSRNLYLILKANLQGRFYANYPITIDENRRILGNMPKKNVSFVVSHFQGHKSICLNLFFHAVFELCSPVLSSVLSYESIRARMAGRD